MLFVIRLFTKEEVNIAKIHIIFESARFANSFFSVFSHRALKILLKVAQQDLFLQNIQIRVVRNETTTHAAKMRRFKLAVD